MSNKAIFLDRDGVINVEKDYVHKIEDFEFYPGTIEALKKIPKDYKIIVVTNQGGISKGYYTVHDFNVLSKHMLEILQNEGIKIDGIYHCPHHDEHNCECRKPGNKMLLDAKLEHDIDFENSYMIGDKLHDISAGKKSGCKTILVRTGHGNGEEQKIMEKNIHPDHIADDIFGAVNFILNGHEKKMPRAFILAGGLGTRLGELTKDKPKPMMDINGKPFLEYIIELCRKQGIIDIVLCTGYKSQVISDYFGDESAFGVKIQYSNEPEPLGPAGWLKLARRYIEDTFIVMNGDTYMDFNAKKVIEFHKKHSATLTILCVKTNGEGRSGGIGIDASGKVISFDEKIEKDIISAGLYICSKSLMDSIDAIESEKISFEKDIFPNLALQGKVCGFVEDKEFIDIGIPSSLEHFRNVMKQGD